MTSQSARTIRIATRSSRLALWQAEHVSALIRGRFPETNVEIIHVSTIGDRDLSGPLRDMGAQGVFTREVQRVVLDDHADLAVHSLKDLPTETAAGLSLAAVPARGEMFDALVLPACEDQESPVVTNWESLPVHAKIGTGSVRRRAQFWHVRPDFTFHDVRGNVETRLRKLDAGEYDALVLAVAGLQRLELADRISQVLMPPMMFPAVGQGALGLECRESDAELRAILAEINDSSTNLCVTAERVLMAELKAGCHAPVAVWSSLKEGQLTFQGIVLSGDGKTRLSIVETRPCAEIADSEQAGRDVAAQLIAHGARTLIENA